MKRFIFIAITVLSALKMSAYDFEVDGLYYNMLSSTDLTCGITSGDKKYTGDINIPASVTYKSRELAVTSIGEYAFDGCSSLTSLSIPNSVTSIGLDAFRGCSSLTSISIPNSVTKIGSEAFYGCSSLTSVSIPNSVTEIGDEAFYGCSALTSVSIPNSVTEIGVQAFDTLSSLIIEESQAVLLFIADYVHTKGYMLEKYD